MATRTYRTPIYLFDLDGTLVDSVGLIMTSFAHAMTLHRGEVPDPNRFRASIGQPLLTQFSMYSEDPAERERLVESYSEYYRAHRAEAVLFDGVRELLEGLHARRTPMAIVTSKSHVGAVRSTEALGIDHFFSCMIGSDDVTHGKPHPEPVRKALDHFGARPAEAIFIGDSPHDMEAGRRASVRTIGVTWGPYSEEDLQRAGVDRIVTTVSALRDP